MIERAKLIAKNNREHFYSQRFEDIILAELNAGFESAFAQQEELFFTKPGGTYFDAARKFMSFDDMYDIRPRNNSILNYVGHQYPELAKQILKQYPDLF